MATYVDSKALYIVMCDWKAKMEENPDEPMPESMGKAIMDIAYGLGGRWNFARYTDTWKENMISDAIEVCVKNVKGFDTVKYNNPHAYITMICFRAFQNRIKKEKRDTAGKYKFFVEHVYDADCSDMARMVDNDFYQDMVKKINDYESSNKSKPVVKQKDQLGGLSWLEEDNDDDNHDNH